MVEGRKGQLSDLPFAALVWTCICAIAFGFVESSVVVYLRAIYYPDGFTFPLKLIGEHHLAVEIVRESATLVMLAGIAVLAGKTGWQRFGYFLIAFGVWDIFYYIWLKILLGWPSSFTDWDVLFLIPLPWIGPVLAPVLVSLVMIGCGWVTVRRIESGRPFRPGFPSWISASCATLLILFSFVGDLPASLKGAMPQPYGYWLLATGLVLYVASCSLACPPETGRNE
jgi:hypothetical protein